MKLKNNHGFMLSLVLSLTFLVGCGEQKEENNNTPIIPPIENEHICEHICGTCGGCLDKNCLDSVCANKCTCSEEPIDPDEPTDIFEAFSDYKHGETQTITDSVMNIETEVTVFSKFSNNDTNVPIAIYVINHKNERVGTASDYYCVNKLLDEYAVVVLDYKNNTLAVSPKLEQSAYKFNATLLAGTFLDGINYDSRYMFVVPSGCLIKRNIVYYDLMKSAPKGWKEKTVSIWNTSAVEDKVTSSGGTYHTANTIDDIILKNGDKLTKQDENGDYPYLQYKMDIVYPVNPEEKAPLILSASSADSRNTIRFNPKKQYRYQVAGFEFHGYAVAVYDHEYYPFMFSEFGWGHIEPNYTLQTLIGNRSHTAAVRCAKYYADELGYSSEKVGVYGHSKSSWCALLSDRNITSCDPEELTEVGVYSGYSQKETYGEQPYKVDKNGNTLNANITCIYHSMGAGTSRAKYYVKEDLIPTMIGCGENCEYNSWSKFYETSGDACVLKYFTNANPNFIDLPMYGVGHEYPYDKTCIKYGYNYYDAFNSYFDYYLKDGDVELFYTSVGTDNSISNKEDLFLQFNCVIDESTLTNGFKLFDSNENEVQGTWTKLRQGNRYVFTPTTELVDSAQYKIVVTNAIKDTQGKALNRNYEETFTYKVVQEDDSEYKSIEGTVLADAMVSTDSVSSNYAKSEVLRVYRSLNGSNNRYSYIKFNLSDLIDNEQYETISQQENAKIRLSFYVTQGETEICDALNVNLFAMPVANRDWVETEMTWSSCKSGGAYGDMLARTTGELLETTFALSEDKIFTIDMKFSDVVEHINTTAGDLYGNITFCLFTNGKIGDTEIGNSIRLASKDSTSNPIPKIEFLYI